MKICHFVSYSTDSNYFAGLGRGFSERGLYVLWGTLFQTGREPAEWMKDAENTDYFCLNAKTKKDFPLAVVKLARLLRRKKIDILQTHLYEASLVGILAARLARVPVRILTRHHTDQAHQIGSKLAIALDRWEAKQVNKVVVLSNAVREFMISADHVDGGKIKVIYQGFDFNKFSATEADRQRVRQEFGITDADFVVGTIGNFFPTKGHRFLVSATKELIDEIPHLKLFFIGSGGDIDGLKAHIKELGLESQVIFAGFRKDVNACMKAVDVVVHPSLSEAFCQVLIETMSVGTPLISTDVGGAAEVIENNETGFLIPPEDVGAIVSALRYVYNNPDLVRQIVSAGQKSVRERFTIDKMVEEQIEFYQLLLNSKH